MMQTNLSIVLPAWNEAANLELLLPELRKNLDQAGIQYEIIVVDAGSKDNTIDVVRNNGGIYMLQTQPGYGGALLTGYAAARGEYVATLDADGSHDPQSLLKMWAIRETADVFIGSRYVAGGGSEADTFRKLLSWILNKTYRVFFDIPVLDLSSGFRLYNKNALNIEIHARHFEFLEELLVKQFFLGCRIKEVPFWYRPRKFGESHAKLYAFGKLYLKSIARLRADRHVVTWSSRSGELASRSQAAGS